MAMSSMLDKQSNHNFWSEFNNFFLPYQSLIMSEDFDDFVANVDLNYMVNIGFWALGVLVLIYVLYARIFNFFFKAANIEYFKRNQFARLVWNLAFYAASTLFLYFYSELIVWPQLSKHQGGRHSLFHSSENHIFYKPQHYKKFQFYSIFIIDFYLHGAVLDFLDFDFLECVSKTLYLLTLLAINVARYEYYFVELNLYLGLYNIMTSLLLLIAVQLPAPARTHVLLSPVLLLLLLLLIWFYVHITLIPFRYLVPTLFAKNFNLLLNACFWLWYGLSIWNSPVLKFIYHQIYHGTPAESPGCGSAASHSSSCGSSSKGVLKIKVELHAMSLTELKKVSPAINNNNNNTELGDLLAVQEHFLCKMNAQQFNKSGESESDYNGLNSMAASAIKSQLLATVKSIDMTSSTGDSDCSDGIGSSSSLTDSVKSEPETSSEASSEGIGGGVADPEAILLQEMLTKCNAVFATTGRVIPSKLISDIGALIGRASSDAASNIERFRQLQLRLCSENIESERQLAKVVWMMECTLDAVLDVMYRSRWQNAHIAAFNACLSDTILACPTKSKNLTELFLRTYMDQLEKTSQGDIKPEQVDLLMRPFADYILTVVAKSTLDTCIKSLFYKLLIIRNSRGRITVPAIMLPLRTSLLQRIQTAHNETCAKKPRAIAERIRELINKMTLHQFHAVYHSPYIMHDDENCVVNEDDDDDDDDLGDYSINAASDHAVVPVSELPPAPKPELSSQASRKHVKMNLEIQTIQLPVSIESESVSSHDIAPAPLLTPKISILKPNLPQSPIDLNYVYSSDNDVEDDDDIDSDDMGEIRRRMGAILRVSDGYKWSHYKVDQEVCSDNDYDDDSDSSDNDNSNSDSDSDTQYSNRDKAHFDNSDDSDSFDCIEFIY